MIEVICFVAGVFVFTIKLSRGVSLVSLGVSDLARRKISGSPKMSCKLKSETDWSFFNLFILGRFEKGGREKQEITRAQYCATF